MFERWMVNVLAFAILGIVTIVPIPLARGLWVWTVWSMFHGTVFRFNGRPLSYDELEDAAPVDARAGLLWPFSKEWRLVRRNIIRNRVLYGRSSD